MRGDISQLFSQIACATIIGDFDTDSQFSSVPAGTEARRPSAALSTSSSSVFDVLQPRV